MESPIHVFFNNVLGRTRTKDGLGCLAGPKVFRNFIKNIRQRIIVTAEFMIYRLFPSADYAELASIGSVWQSPGLCPVVNLIHCPTDGW